MLRHVGLAKHRLKEDNPREVAFTKVWKRENKNSYRLLTLIKDASQRDADVAATIIQWLGSNVGIAFLNSVIKASPEVRRDLKGWVNIDDE